MSRPYHVRIAGGPHCGLLPSGRPAVTHACYKHVSRRIMNPGRRCLWGKLWIFFTVLPPVLLPLPSWQPRSCAGSFPDAEKSQGSEALFPAFFPVVCFAGCVG